VIGLVRGEAFLTGSWIFPGGLPLGSPLLFDVGVFLTVLGAVLHMLLRLLEREQAGDGTHDGAASRPTEG
jgi:multicomponent Na+:H+ antiporter subunit A